MVAGLIICLFLFSCCKADVTSKDEPKNEGLPSFKWLSGNKNGSELEVTYPDGEKDVALLKHNDAIDHANTDACLLIGNLKNEPGASVSVDGCPFKDTFTIVLGTDKLSNNKYSVKNGKVSVVKKRTPKESDKPTDDEVLDEKPGEEIEDDSSTIDTRDLDTRSIPKLPATMKVYALYDIFFHNRFKGNAENAKSKIRKFMNDAQTLFSHASLINTINITLDLIDVVFVNKQVHVRGHELNHVAGPHSNTLMEDKDADVYLYFSTSGVPSLSGIAVRDGICSPLASSRTALIKYTGGDDTDETIAHEIGHLIGMRHDFEKDATGRRIERPDGPKLGGCIGKGGTMDYYGASNNWSPCSNSDVVKLYHKKMNEFGHYCLFKDQVPVCAPAIKRTCRNLEVDDCKTGQSGCSFCKFFKPKCDLCKQSSLA